MESSTPGHLVAGSGPCLSSCVPVQRKCSSSGSASFYTGHLGFIRIYFSSLLFCIYILKCESEGKEEEVNRGLPCPAFEDLELSGFAFTFSP